MILPLLPILLQSVLLVAVGLALPAMLRLEDPRARLLYYRGLLLALLALPFVQPAGNLPAFSQEIAVTGLIPAAVSEGAGPALERLALAVGVLGGVGILARLIWLGIGLVTLATWRREARPAALSPEVEGVADLIPVKAQLLMSDRVASPVTFGWRRPVVLLPPQISTLSKEAQRGIVGHELIHVRRGDWLSALFEEGVRALFWFHPGVWMLLARIALSREQVVDREAVRLTGSRRAYLEALRTVACRSWQPAMPVLADVAEMAGLPFFQLGRPNELRERVAHLRKEVSMSRSRIATLISASAGLLAVTAVLGILVFPASPMSGTAWAGGKPYNIEGNVQAPKALHTQPPVYPEKAKADKVAGIAVVQTVIDETGRVTQPTIKGSSGDKSLDQAAIDAVSAWTFQPATLDGKPVAVYYTLTIRFALE